MRNVNAYLQEAEAIIAKMGQQKTASAASSDNVEDLARELVADTASDNLTVKIAEAFAIVDTIINLETLSKLAEFEKRAQAAGKNPDDIAAFMEKNANLQMVSALSLVPWLNRK